MGRSSSLQKPGIFYKKALACKKWGSLISIIIADGALYIMLLLKELHFFWTDDSYMARVILDTDSS